MKKTIINFCPTGMIPTKKMNPHVPESPVEIIEQTHEAYELGISIVHLHARDDHGVPTHDSKVYEVIISGVRKYCPGLVVCCSTSGRNSPEFEKRSEVIELQPDMCSLTLSSLNFFNSASVNSPEIIQKLLNKMIEYGVKPEFECFDLGMINYGKYLIKKHEIKDRNYWNVLFGNIAGLQPSFDQLGVASNLIPDTDFVCFAGLGEFQTKTISLAIASGYGVRIGLEDNIWYDSLRKKLATNIDLLKRVHQLMQIHEHSLALSKDLGFYNKLNSNK